MLFQSIINKLIRPQTVTLLHTQMNVIGVLIASIEISPVLNVCVLYAIQIINRMIRPTSVNLLQMNVHEVGVL